jgi:uncharacterized protein
LVKVFPVLRAKTRLFYIYIINFAVLGLRQAGVWGKILGNCTAFEASLAAVTYGPRVSHLPAPRAFAALIRCWIVILALLLVAAPAPHLSQTARAATLAPAHVLAPPQPALLDVKLTFPRLTGRVVDEAHCLPPEERARLEDMLASHEKRTGQQVVVVTLNSLQGDAIDDYGYQLGRAWGIGQKGKNNGVLIILAPNEKKVRIESGYGVEGALTDASANTIITTVMMPGLQAEAYDVALMQGTKAVLALLAPPETPRPQPPAGDQQLTPFQAALGAMALLFLLWLSIAHPQVAWFLLRFTLMIIDSSSSRGGGFSGGGGSFGGGGASGSW